MRLRYLYLPDFGPLKEVAVVFGQNRHIERRRGTVNFVVGLNGTGKSSLLRAIYSVFHSLSQEELPGFPVTLAYDMLTASGYQTAIVHRPHGPSASAFLVPAAECVHFVTADEWQTWIRTVVAPAAESWPGYVAGDRLRGDGNLRNWLPVRVLAYTSGDPKPWEAIAYPSFPTDELKDTSEDFDPDRERPAGWTAEREDLHRLNTKADPADLTSKSMRAPVIVHDDHCILLQPEDARLAAIAVAIWQAALELQPRSEQREREAFRNERLAELGQRTPVNGVRGLLNELDWLWPTHASFHFMDDADRPLHPDAARRFWLLALADAVVAHPLNEALAVVALGARPPIRPEELVGEEPLEEPLRLAGEPLRNACCGAEALRLLLAGEQDPHESLWSIFRALHDWRVDKVLRDVQLTVKRIRQVPGGDGALDDHVLSYASFSDGEQMLLGRMSILLLLQRRDNTLLLLDEPETHFNDAWKRQIIDMVDDSILRDTSAQVLVSTHTSLALTDVFSCEIARLVKVEGVATVQPVVHPTFGADPGRLLLHVFGAPDVIGARAAEFLRSKLDPAKWPPEDRDKLRALIDDIGSGWPRAKLMAILETLDSSDAPPDP